MTRRVLGKGAFCLLLATALAGPAGAGEPEREGSPAPAADEASAAAPKAKAAPDARQEVASESAARPAGRIARATFTTAVVDREPIDSIDALDTEQTEVAFFTELRDFTGETVIHRWEHGGRVVAEVPVEVRGPRWRAYSTKQLDPAEAGDWTVSVVDASGQVLESASLEYREAVPAPTASAPGGARAASEEATAASAPASAPAAPAP
jgi:hypothetical protein